MFITLLVVIAMVGIAVPPSEAATKAPAEPKECKFPFVYNGESYWMCSNPDYDPRGPWCSTETDDKNNYITGKYKYCDEPQECKFPFIFNGVTYWKCSNPDSDPGGPWCSTETDSMNNYITRKYKYCDAQEEGRMAEVGKGIFPEPEDSRSRIGGSCAPEGRCAYRCHRDLGSYVYRQCPADQSCCRLFREDGFPIIQPRLLALSDYRSSIGGSCAPEGRCAYICHRDLGSYVYRRCPADQSCCRLFREDGIPIIQPRLLAFS